MSYAAQQGKMICIIGIDYEEATISFNEQILSNELFLVTSDSLNAVNSTKKQSKYTADSYNPQTLANPEAGILPFMDRSEISNSTHTVWKINMCGNVFSAFFHCLKNDTFRRSFLDGVRYEIQQQQPCIAPSFAQIHFRLSMPQRNEIHYKSQSMAFQKLFKAIELEDATHWLSTLGGAYSNLGEGSISFAHKACTNALHQMKIALRSEDPSIIHRCWLYVAMSLMQQGKLLSSRRIIERIYREATNSSHNGATKNERIVKMCHGIWARLKYVWTNGKHAIKMHQCSKGLNI